MPKQKDQKDQQAEVSLGARIRRAALFVFFAAMLLIPKTLALRRRRWLWNALRLGLALLGAVLITAVRGDPTARFSPVVGLLLLLLALLLRPTREGESTDEIARQLGALVVVNGGHWQDVERQPAVRLFVGPERVHVLDSEHEPRLEIPLGAVTGLRVEQTGRDWQLRIEWHQGRAVFHYAGSFPEHLARVAEATLRSQLRRELAVMK